MPSILPTLLDSADNTLFKKVLSNPNLLDQSAAFDTIDHSILLHRLSSWFGICDQALAWFTSYLTTRSFAVSCADHASSPSPLSCGVPHGSVLGPILFTMYTTPLSSLIGQMSACREQSHVDHHLYADDTQLFISFSPCASMSALDSLHVSINAVSQWMASNLLTLNPSKTEFLIIGLPRQLSKLQQPHLQLPKQHIHHTRQLCKEPQYHI